MNQIFQFLRPYLIALGIFLAVSLAYCLPVLSGKILGANDLILGEVLKKSAEDYNQKTGEVVHWTNKMFSGMPDNYGTGLSNLFYKVPLFIGSQLMHGHYSFDTLLWFMIAAYILFLAIGASNELAIGGAIAISLSTFNLMGLEGGHVMKVLAAGCLPGVLAGLIFLAKKKYWPGTIFTIFYMNIMLSLNHTQITYYMLIMIILFSLIVGIIMLLEKEVKHVAMVAGIIAGITLLSAIANYNLLNVVVSAKETIRSGVSELSVTDNKSKPKEGLDYDYATSWSNGKLETFTWFAPNFAGGKSGESFLDNPESNTLKALQAHSTEANQYVQRTGTYWGEQNFVSGGVYFGILMIMLCIFGMIVIPDKTKWAFFGIGLFFLLLSYGRNLSAFTDIAFYNFPMYNKFRVPSMCLSVVQVIISLLAIWGLWELFQGKKTSAEKLRAFYFAAGSTAAILVLFIIAGNVFIPFLSDADKLGNPARGMQPIPLWLQSALKQDRFAMMRADAIRSLLFLAVGSGIIWAFITSKVKEKAAAIAIVAVMIIDVGAVSKRYLSDEDFIEKTDFSAQLQASQADQQLFTDPSDYRVLNVFDNGYGPNPFNDAATSYHHQSIGGYHPAKLRRYQELIENQIAKGNPMVFNMLNMKYQIVGNPQSGPQIQMNPGAMGNAWFVPEVKVVNNGKEEMDAMNFQQENPMNSWDPRRTAIVQKKYAEGKALESIQFDSAASIKQTMKDPHHVKYSVSNLKNKSLAVFSEIYYKQEDGDGFKAFIDGKETEVLKCNYVLRGLVVPAGAKEIEFRYDSSQFDSRNRISFFTSLLLLCIIIFILYRWIKDENIITPASPTLQAESKQTNVSSANESKAAEKRNPQPKKKK